MFPFSPIQLHAGKRDNLWKDFYAEKSFPLGPLWPAVNGDVAFPNTTKKAAKMIIDIRPMDLLTFGEIKSHPKSYDTPRIPLPSHEKSTADKSPIVQFGNINWKEHNIVMIKPKQKFKPNK